MIQWWQILLLTLYSAYQICDELTIVSSAGFTWHLLDLCRSHHGRFTSTGLLIGCQPSIEWYSVLGSSLVLLVLTLLLVRFLPATFSVRIKPELAISTIAVPVAALLTTSIFLVVWPDLTAHRVDAAIERFDYKEGIERNYLLGALQLGWHLVPSSLLLPCLWWRAFMKLSLQVSQQYNGAANGLRNLQVNLPGLGFAILLRYLPVKHLHYLALVSKRQLCWHSTLQ